MAAPGRRVFCGFPPWRPQVCTHDSAGRPLDKATLVDLPLHGWSAQYPSPLDDPAKRTPPPSVPPLRLGGKQPPGQEQVLNSEFNYAVSPGGSCSSASSLGSKGASAAALAAQASGSGIERWCSSVEDWHEERPETPEDHGHECAICFE